MALQRPHNFTVQNNYSKTPGLMCFVLFCFPSIRLENSLQSHEYKTNQKVAFKKLTFQSRSQMVNKTALDLALVGWREGEGTTLYSYTQSQLRMTYLTGQNNTPSTAKPSVSKRFLEQQTPAYRPSLIFFRYS